VEDAPWGIVALGLLFGAAFIGVGLVGTIDWRGWNSAQATRHADLFRLSGPRRERHLRSQRVLGRIIGPFFVLAGATALVFPLLSRLV
jgi:hypothetical protein